MLVGMEHCRETKSRSNRSESLELIVESSLESRRSRKIHGQNGCKTLVILHLPFPVASIDQPRPYTLNLLFLFVFILSLKTFATIPVVFRHSTYPYIQQLGLDNRPPNSTYSQRLRRPAAWVWSMPFSQFFRLTNAVANSHTRLHTPHDTHLLRMHCVSLAVARYGPVLCLSSRCMCRRHFKTLPLFIDFPLRLGSIRTSNHHIVLSKLCLEPQLRLEWKSTMHLCRSAHYFVALRLCHHRINAVQR